MSCQCTLSTTEQVRATSDNCVRDDPRTEPLATRFCGIKCPNDPPPATPTLVSTSQLPHPGTRMYSRVTVILQCKKSVLPVCRWTSGEFSKCSATCEGTQNRRVFCQCTQPTGESLVAHDNVCGSEDSRLKPQTSRSCGGIKCPITTEPPRSGIRMAESNYNSTVMVKFVYQFALGMLEDIPRVQPPVKEHKLGQ